MLIQVEMNSCLDETVPLAIEIAYVGSLGFFSVVLRTESEP